MGGLTFEPFGGEAHLANRAASNTHTVRVPNCTENDGGGEIHLAGGQQLF